MSAPADAVSAYSQHQSEVPVIAIEFPGSKEIPLSLEKNFCSANDLESWFPPSNQSRQNLERTINCELGQQLHALTEAFRSIRSFEIGNLYIYSADGLPLRSECDAQTILFDCCG